MCKQGLPTKVLMAMCLVLALEVKAVSRSESDRNAEIGFKAIPTLQNGVGKGYYAIFQGESYDALIVASNLNVLVFPKEEGERIEKPIEFSNRFVYTPHEGDFPNLMQFTGVTHLAPPAVITTGQRITIQALSTSGFMLYQTWEFFEDTIVMEEHFKGTLSDPLPVMRTFFTFPRTHRFTPNIELADRIKATSGYSLHLRAGKSDTTMRTMVVPYVGKPENLPDGEWVENQGPWGTRRVTIKRTSHRGSIGMGTQWNRCVYDGLEMCFTAKPDPYSKIKRIDPQGFEVKIE